MTTTPELDRAIRAYNKAYDVPDDWPIRDADREAFRAGVAELLRGLTDYRDPLAEIKRRAGVVEAGC